MALTARLLFCRLLGAIYAVAFASVAVQWDGLFGFDGLEPAGVVLDVPRAKDGAPAVWAAYKERPTLLLAHKIMGMELDTMAHAVCATGVLLGALVAVGLAGNSVAFAALHLLYLSLYLVGQTFLSFQWDILLLEVGVLAVLYAPALNPRSTEPAPGPATWAVRFCLFKLMLLSGVVKVQSQCPTWLGLTATAYHYATQCIPTPGAWYAHQLPMVLHKFEVAATLWIEMPLTLLILVPFRSVSLIAAGSQILLQALIMLTGNYTFFNWLTVALCVPMLATNTNGARAGSPWSIAAIDRLGPLVWVTSVFRWVDGNKWMRAAVVAGTLGACVWVWVTMFDFVWETQSAGGGDDGMLSEALDAMDLTLALSVKEINRVLKRWLWPVLSAFLAGFSISCLRYLVSEISATGAPADEHESDDDDRSSSSGSDDGVDRRTPKRRRRLEIVLRAVWATLVCLAAGSVVLASTVTFSTVERGLSKDIPEVAFNAYHALQPLHATSGYGLFRRMTGVGTNSVDEYGRPVAVVHRPEVVLQGSMDGGRTWQDIEFKYKPGNVTHAPPVVAPHQPRLDWQMWFAALGSYQAAPWTIHLVDKVLEGSPSVLALLDLQRYPWKSDEGAPLAPQVARMQHHKYDFTYWDSKRARRLPSAGVVDAEPAENEGAVVAVPRAQWWFRIGEPQEYVPPVARGDEHVEMFIKSRGWQRVTDEDRRKATARQRRCGVPRKGSEHTGWVTAGGVLCRLAVFARDFQRVFIFTVFAGVWVWSAAEVFRVLRPVKRRPYARTESDSDDSEASTGKEKLE